MRRLYSASRSSASWRVRIALNLKGLDYDYAAVNLRADGGEQNKPGFKAVNPQGLVPVLDDDGVILNQSLAIIDYLDATYRDPPFLSGDAKLDARIRSLALTIACDIHPLNNLRVLQYLGRDLEIDTETVNVWYRHWVNLGFAAIEPVISDRHKFCFGDNPSLADICLIPQIGNAERFDVDLEPYPGIRAVKDAAMTMKAFQDALPGAQPDAE